MIPRKMQLRQYNLELTFSRTINTYLLLIVMSNTEKPFGLL